jgi:hypothetical protein
MAINNMRFSYVVFLVVIFLLSACKEEYPFYDGPGKAPVYLPYEKLSEILNLHPKPVVNSGPVFLEDTLLFMIEQQSGIHVFSLSDTANPVQLTFFQIPAVNDFTISGNTMYADNGPNLITIDISDIYNIVVLNTQQNVFYPVYFPQLYRGFFECVDQKKGVVVGWKDTTLADAKCRTTN